MYFDLDIYFAVIAVNTIHNIGFCTDWYLMAFDIIFITTKYFIVGI